MKFAQTLRKFEVAVRKEGQKRKVFYISMLPNLFLAESSWSFERPGLDLGNKRPRRQTIFGGFLKSGITGGNK